MRAGFQCMARLSNFYHIATGRQPDPATVAYDAYLYVQVGRSLALYIISASCAFQSSFPSFQRLCCFTHRVVGWRDSADGGPEFRYGTICCCLAFIHSCILGDGIVMNCVWSKTGQLAAVHWQLVQHSVQTSCLLKHWTSKGDASSFTTTWVMAPCCTCLGVCPALDLHVVCSCSGHGAHGPWSRTLSLGGPVSCTCCCSSRCPVVVSPCNTTTICDSTQKCRGQDTVLHASIAQVRDVHLVVNSPLGLVSQMNAELLLHFPCYGKGGG